MKKSWESPSNRVAILPQVSCALVPPYALNFLPREKLFLERRGIAWQNGLVGSDLIYTFLGRFFG